MNIEELSKSQLILLTILVNFVTSVATGILTVSLLDQAPAFVTKTVNRVVEHTIETVKQVPSVATVITPAPSTQELVTGALGAAATRVVAISVADAASTTPAVAIGTYLPKSRVVVTAEQDKLPLEGQIAFADGSTRGASLARVGGGLAIYGFADDAKLPEVTAFNLVAANRLSLGATALAIGVDGAAATGIISRVGDTGIRTTLPDIGAGSAAVDLSGNLIGVALGDTPGLLTPADAISALLTATSTGVAGEAE